MLFSKSQTPSYAINAATLSSTTVMRTVATPTQEDDNLMQFESQQPLKPISGFRPVHTVSTNIMDQTMDMDVVPGKGSQPEAMVTEEAKENIPVVESTLFDKANSFLSRLPLMTATTITKTNHRHSLPLQPSNLDPTQRYPPPSLASPSSRKRKSLSPRHTARRTSVSHSFGNTSLGSTSTHGGTLLALPLVDQYAALRTRHAKLEKSNSSQASSHAGDLARAMGRIATLEKTLEGMEVERDGWQSEATRMTAELAAVPAIVEKIVIVENGAGDADNREELEAKVDELQASLDKEAQKKRRYKSLGDKLRCELESRRLKERWDLGIMDADDREDEAKTIGLEYEVTRLVLKNTLQLIEQEELEDFVASQKAQLAALTSARSILLTSFKTSQSNLSTIRMELNAAAKELARERDSASTTKRDLVRTKASLKLAETEIVETKATCSELEESVKQLSSDATGDIKKDEAVERQLNELKKTIEKEKSKREKTESDAKDLKSSLKSAQAELGDAQRSAKAAMKAAELATRAAEIAQATMLSASTSSSTISKPAKEKKLAPTANKKRKAVAEVIEEEEEEEAEEAEEKVVDEVDLSIEEPPVAPKPRAKKVAKPVPIPVIASPISPSSNEEQEEEEDSYRPSQVRAKFRSRSVSVAPAVAEVAAKKIKKEKVSKPVLGEKSTNGKSRKMSVEPAGEKKKTKKRDLVAVQEEVVAGDEENEEPAKKKKKKSLFPGGKKFVWSNTAETTDINGLGLPSILSPVKSTSSVSIFGAGKGGARSSIFGL